MLTLDKVEEYLAREQQARQATKKEEENPEQDPERTHDRRVTWRRRALFFV